MPSDQQGLGAWARHWHISDNTLAALVERLCREPLTPPFTDLPPHASQEVQGLPLAALAQLRDVVRPDLYPPRPT